MQLMSGWWPKECRKRRASAEKYLSVYLFMVCLGQVGIHNLFVLCRKYLSSIALLHSSGRSDILAKIKRKERIVRDKPEDTNNAPWS